MQLCLSLLFCLVVFLGVFFILVWVWGFGVFFPFTLSGTLGPWMFGNCRSLTACSESQPGCNHYVFVKTCHKSHMQGVSSFMEQLEFLTMLCMGALHVYSKSSMA